MLDKLQQTKLNAISARILHTQCKMKLERTNLIIAFLTVIVPTLFIIAIFTSKGTSFENGVNVVSFILSVFLICVSVWSYIRNINDRIVTHKLGVKNNIYIITECDNLVKGSAENIEWFFRYVAEMDTQDLDSLSLISETTRQTTYRQALKELIPGDVTIVCSLCQASPWKYKKGSCQLCGNTPIQN